MCGTACLTSVNMPLTLVVRTASHSSSVSCSIGMTLVMPALQTSTSMAAVPARPVSATIRPASAIEPDVTVDAADRAAARTAP